MNRWPHAATEGCGWTPGGWCHHQRPSPQACWQNPKKRKAQTVNGYTSLALAIVAEVVATSALQASAGFTRLWPSVLVVLGYGVAFYCLSITLKTVPMGVAYALWSGLGIVLITASGWVLYRQRVDTAALLGMALIVAGVAVIQLFSKTTAH